MGEANRRKAIFEATRIVSRELMNRGLIMEAGWATMRQHFLPNDAPPELVQMARDCFFSGAQHLFFGMMAGMDDGLQETPDDMKRMARIDSELTSFASDFTSRNPIGHDLYSEMKGAVRQ